MALTLRTKRLLLVAILLAVLLTGWLVMRFVDFEGPRPLTVSKETTYFTEPLDEHGLVDYVAAVNRVNGAGVTKENNAAVILLEVARPDLNPGLSEADRAHFRAVYRKLGLDLPETGEPFLSLKEFIDGKAAEDATDEQRKAWVEKYSARLDRVVEASRREHFFVPRAEPPGSEGEGYLSSLTGTAWFRDLLGGLRQRSEIRASTGRVGAATDDLLAALRLGRLVLRRPADLVWAMTACRQRNLAAKALMERLGRPAADNARRRTIEQLKPVLGEDGPMAWVMDKGERVMVLSSVKQLYRIGGDPAEQVRRAMPGESLREAVYWNDLSRRINQRYDRLVEAARVDSPARRLAMLRLIDAETTASMQDFRRWFETNLTGTWGGIKSAFWSRATQRQVLTQVVENLLMTTLWPAIGAPAEKILFAERQVILARITAGIHLFRHEHQRFPKALEELTPGILKENPADPITGEQMLYKPTAEGYILKAPKPKPGAPPAG